MRELKHGGIKSLVQGDTEYFILAFKLGDIFHIGEVDITIIVIYTRYLSFS